MDSTIDKLYLAIPLASLFGAVIAGFFGSQIGRKGAHTITILGVGTSFVLSLVALNHHVFDGAPAYNHSVYEWMVPNIDSDDCFVRLSVDGLPNSSSINTIPFAIQKAVSVEDNNLNPDRTLSIFPNPVKDKAFVSFPKGENDTDECFIEIFTVGGNKLIESKEIVSRQMNNTVELDLSALPKGVYVLKLKFTDKVYTGKFIK